MTQVMMSPEQMSYEANWPMPSVKAGEPIVYFIQWNDTNKRSTGFVTNVSHRSIDCLTIGPNGQQYIINNVLHKDDPRLIHNVNLQRNGAWDYSDLEKRVQALEMGLSPAVRPVAANRTDSVTENVTVPVKKQKRPLTAEQKAAKLAGLTRWRAAQRQQQQVEREHSAARADDADLAREAGE